MNRKLFIVLCLISIFSLVSCLQSESSSSSSSGGDSSEATLVGTWTLDTISCDGEEDTMDDAMMVSFATETEGMLILGDSATDCSMQIDIDVVADTGISMTANPGIPRCYDTGELVDSCTGTETGSHGNCSEEDNFEGLGFVYDAYTLSSTTLTITHTKTAEDGGAYPCEEGETIEIVYTKL